MPKRLKRKGNKVIIKEIFRSSVEEQEQFPVKERTSGRANFSKKEDGKSESTKKKSKGTKKKGKSKKK